MKGFKISIQSLANKIIAILIIFCIIFANFGLVGSNIVEAVAEELENQKTIEKGENISFDAFFEKEENRTHQAQLNMEEEQNLHIELIVKDKFSVPNATIKIEDPNFNIIKDKVESSKYINNINADTNEIELKNIYSNNTVSITLPIKFKKSDLINKNYFNKEIEISLKGKYEDTKQREKTLEGDIKIKPEWTANTEINLTQSIEKYFSLGSNGTLLQQKIETEVVNNIVPRNTETIQTIAPLIANQRPEKVTVLIDGARVNKENVKYNKEDGTVLISYSNIDNNEGNIKWGEGKKEYTIMYNYLNTAELVATPVELKTNSQTSLYTKGNNITKEDTQNISATPIGNLVTSKTTLVGDLYKGYLYENEEKEIEYKERNDIEVSYTEGIEKIELQTNNNIYTNEAGKGVMLANNLRYKETKVNKAEILDILGEEGILTIKRANGEIITQINKDSEADEKGIITVKYGETETNIIVETTAPKTEGIITVLNTKAIKGETNQQRNTIKLIKNLVVVPEITTNMNKESSTASIELKEPTSEASIETNVTSLTTTQENENVEIKATLKTNSPSQNLYTNPVVTIEFPKDIQTVKVNSINKIFGDEFSTLNASQGVVDGKQVIKMQLIGDQREHKEVGTEGTVININANLTLNNRALSKKDNIVMTYTNAKANQYKDAETTKTEEATVEIVSPRSLITTNNISELGVSTVGEQKGVNVAIPIKAEQKVLTVESEVINNNEREISDVKVMGTFGTKGKTQIGEEQYENNINTQLTSGLNIEGIDTSKVKVYYTENEEATEDIKNSENKWQQTVKNVETAKKYLVQVSNMNVAETMKISYGIAVPENLQYRQQMYQGYTVKYNDNQANAEQEMEATTIALKTPEGPELSAKLTANVGLDNLSNGAKVKKGEVIEYNVELENTGDEDLTQVQIAANVPDGTVLLADEYAGTFGRYSESEDRTVQIQIPEIKVGETINQPIRVKVLQNIESAATISEQVNVNCNNIHVQSNQIDLAVEQQSDGIEVRTEFEQILNDFSTVDEETAMDIKITNTTQEEIRNVKVSWNLPEQLKLLYMWTLDNPTNKIEENSYTIEKIDPGETVFVFGRFKIVETNKLGILKFNSQATYNNNTYRANVANMRVKKDGGFSIKLSSDVDKEYVNPGENINYTIEIKNESDITKYGIDIKDELPTGLILLSATQTDGAGETSDLKISGNKFSTKVDFGANETKIIRLKTTVYNIDNLEKDLVISNKAILEKNGEKLNESSAITYTLKTTTPTNPPTTEPSDSPGDNPSTDPSSNPSTDPSGEPSGNPSTDPSGEPSQSPETTTQGVISGYAWVDGDLNGAKDDYENTVENMTVKLLNVETNEFAEDEEGNQIQGITDSTGLYTLENVPQGKYVVIFEYDTKTYKVTEYQKVGVDSAVNSKAISKTLKIDEEAKTYGITDILEMQEDSNISNMNIGLVTTGIFDFALEKYISKITVRTTDGDVKTYNYDKEALAKIELDSKKIDGANVIIEYKIEAKNVGEVSGYVKTIEDYIPEDMIFNSELNKDWYQTETGLKTNSLQNEAIAPGESGVVTLILTKTMTENNTGIMGNTAEITEAYNEEGTQDVNSTPGNGDKNEDDYSAADAIVSVKTGSELVYTTMIIVILLMAGIGIYFVRKETLDMSEDIFKGL